MVTHGDRHFRESATPLHIAQTVIKAMMLGDIVTFLLFL